jgi:hypothetical protein
MFHFLTHELARLTGRRFASAKLIRFKTIFGFNKIINADQDLQRQSPQEIRYRGNLRRALPVASVAYQGLRGGVG